MAIRPIRLGPVPVRTRSIPPAREAARGYGSLPLQLREAADASITRHQISGPACTIRARMVVDNEVFVTERDARVLGSCGVRQD